MSKLQFKDPKHVDIEQRLDKNKRITTPEELTSLGDKSSTIIGHYIEAQALVKNRIIKELKYCKLNLSDSLIISNLKLDNCVIEGTEPKRFMQCTFNNCVFLGKSYKELSDCTITSSVFISVDMSYSNLSDTLFNSCKFLSVNFVGILINKNTLFQNTETVLGSEILAFTLDRMSENPHRFDKYDISEFYIIDQFADLKKQFSPITRIIHFIAILCFLIPYASFLLKCYFAVIFTEDKLNGPTILSAFLDYLRTGGNLDGATNILLICLVVFSLFYNLLRFTILIKIRDLELNHEYSKAPINFNLRQPITKAITWEKAIYCLNKLFIINIIVSAVHIFHFLMTKLPTGFQY